MNSTISRSKASLWAVGLMLFALFFGAGNLIFPAFLGQQAGENWLSAMFGFLLTGAGLPLLGVIAVGYSGSRDVEALASRVALVRRDFCHGALSGNRPSVCHAAYGDSVF
jgi:LIVCS family branched-chain amino acid:cation transporter